MTEVMELLRGVGAGYNVTTCLLNPVQIGEPVHRPRYYFIGTRRDVALVPEEKAQLVYNNVWWKLQQGRPSVSLAQRMLPADHPKVVAHQLYRQQRWQSARADGYPDRRGQAKWKLAHAKWEESQCLIASPAMLSSDQMLLHLPRERDVWAKLVARTRTTGARLVADVSQSLGRNPARTDGTLPTITPGGHVLVEDAQRSLVPVEKLLIHALPLHLLKLPSCLSDKDIEKMGGNMMHLQTVAVAMMLALSFVDWSMSAARAAPPARSMPAARAALGAPAAQAALALAQRQQSKRVEALLYKRYGYPCHGNRKPRGVPKAAKRSTKVRGKGKTRGAQNSKLPKHVVRLRGTRWANAT